MSTVIRVPAHRHNVGLLSILTDQGKTRFMLVRPTIDAQRLLRFLARRVLEISRKVILILNTLEVRHATLVRAWLEAHRNLIEVSLPASSLEIKPNEHRKGEHKTDGRGDGPPQDAQGLVWAVAGHLHPLRPRSVWAITNLEHPCHHCAAV